MKGGATMTGWACSSSVPTTGMQGTTSRRMCSWLRVGDGAIRKTEAGDGQDQGVEAVPLQETGTLPTGSKVTFFVFDWQASKSQGSELYSRAHGGVLCHHPCNRRSRARTQAVPTHSLLPHLLRLSGLMR